MGQLWATPFHAFGKFFNTASTVFPPYPIVAEFQKTGYLYGQDQGSKTRLWQTGAEGARLKPIITIAVEPHNHR